MTAGSGRLRGLRRLGRALVDAAFPPKCMVCGRFFPPADRQDPGTETDAPPQAFRRAMAPFLCPLCRDDFPVLDAPRCSHCGGRLGPADAAGPVCGPCRRQPRHFQQVRSFGPYDGSLKAALHQLKYRSRTPLAEPLGRLLFSTFLRHWPDGDVDLVVPVPLHAHKFRRRGFNQAFLLVRQWPNRAAGRRIPLPRGMIRKSVLKRIRETDTQVGKRRGTRRANIQNAFAAGGGDLREKRILLVDDVYTTGATADECARALRESGAARVDVLTLAQTIRNL